MYNNLKDAYDHKKNVDDVLHNKAIEIFFEYLMIGGMPEAVNIFLSTNNFQETRKVIVELYDNYLSDMELYQASPEAIVRAKKVFENIYSQLNKESKNFKPSLLEKDLRNRDLRSSLDWLMFAFLIQKSA